MRRGERAVAEIEDPLAAVQEFCEINAELISAGYGRSRSLLEQAEDQKTFEDTLNGFSERGKTIVKGLQSLGQIHPFVGGEFSAYFFLKGWIAETRPVYVVAVGAFVLVITLDMTRRENDKKVIAVKMKMQELMLVFFEYVPSHLFQDRTLTCSTKASTCTQLLGTSKRRNHHFRASPACHVSNCKRHKGLRVCLRRVP